MAQVTARFTRQGKQFEILVDLDSAIQVRKGLGSINNAVVTDSIFYNIKRGDIASSADLMKIFGTEDLMTIAEKIIKSGEIEMPTEYIKKERDAKYKQVVDFLVKNAVSPEGRPYTPDRIMKSLDDAHVNVLNKPVDQQVQEIIEQLKNVLPIKIEMKKIKITIPAMHTGKAYGVVSQYKEKEEWLGNGDLQVTIRIPTALVFDFYDKLNGVTHGSALAEDVKD